MTEPDFWRTVALRIWRWGPLLAWATLIFVLSHQPKAALAPAQPSGMMAATGHTWLALPLLDWDTLFSKSAHVVVYAILAWLIWRVDSRPGVVLLGTIGYALLDEFHQLFIPGRTGRGFDVLLDSLGALVALWWQQYTLWKKAQRSENGVRL